jgi:DNA-directed RNA polymerase subunit M/transcription elongation factor TFIIS
MNHPLREYARTTFGKHIGTLAKNAEISLLNWSVQSARRRGKEAAWENPEFRRIYKTKLGWLVTELQRPNYVSLSTEVIEGDHVRVTLGLANQLAHRLVVKELDVRQLAKYPAEVLWPEGPWAASMFRMRAKELAKEQAQAALDAAYEGMFKCRRCGKNKVTYTQAQTRSADEPMVRIMCIVYAFLTTFLTPYPDDFLLLSRVWKQVEGLKSMKNRPLS